MLSLTLLGTIKVFSKVAVPFYQCVYLRSPQIPPVLVTVFLYHLSGYKGIVCIFDLNFPDTHDTEHLSVSLLLAYQCLRNVYQILCLFLKSDFYYSLTF